MTKKNNKPKTLTISDGIKSFAKMNQICGAFTEKQAKQHLTNHEYNECKRLGMFGNTKNVRVGKKQLFVLRDQGVISNKELYSKLKEPHPTVAITKPSPKFRRFCDKALGIKDMHHSNSSGLHDVMLTAKFNQLPPEIQASAKPEAELKRELKERIDDLRKNDPDHLESILDKFEQQLEGFKDRFESEGGYSSPCDMAYYNPTTQSYTCYESITRNYSSYDVLCKELSAELQEYTYESIRI